MALSPIHQWVLLLAYSCSYFTILYINPFISLDVALGSENFALILAAIIYSAPMIAQISTYHLFRTLVERTLNIKLLIYIGFGAAAAQMLVLYILTGMNISNLGIALVVLCFNFVVVSYIPTIKSYLSLTSTQSKGKILARFNMFHTISYGIGMLLGGFSYNYLSIRTMLLIAFFVALLAIFMLMFVPIQKGDELKQILSGINTDVQVSAETNNNEKRESLDSSEVSSEDNKDKPYLNLNFALKYQFTLSVISSVIFAMLAPYFDEIGYPSYFYGIANFAATVLGALVLTQAGKLLEKFGPNFFFHYGWISYGLVYLFLLLTQNVFLIILVWSWPAYVFVLGTELIAASSKNRNEVLKAMTFSDIMRSGGMVVGCILGGIIATFLSFKGVIIFGAVGCLVIGITLISIQLLKS